MKIEELEAKANKGEPLPTGLVLPEQCYYLGLVYIYEYYKITKDLDKAMAYKAEIKKTFEFDMALYPNWSVHYQSNKATAEHVEELNQLMLACCENADNCECCKKIKEW